MNTRRIFFFQCGVDRFYNDGFCTIYNNLIFVILWRDSFKLIHRTFTFNNRVGAGTLCASQMHLHPGVGRCSRQRAQFAPKPLAINSSFSFNHFALLPVIESFHFDFHPLIKKTLKSLMYNPFKLLNYLQD